MSETFEIYRRGVLLEVEPIDVDDDGTIYSWEIVSFDVCEAGEWEEWEIPSDLKAIRQFFHNDYIILRELAEMMYEESKAEHESHLEDLSREPF